MRTHLLLLYPRAWRERYGEEFLASIDGRPLRAKDVADVLFGAADAWLSADVRRVTAGSRALSPGGGLMALKSLAVCDRNVTGVTVRDGLIGALVMLAVSALFALLGAGATHRGLSGTAATLKSFAFPAALTLSMPFWLMKGSPWKAQVAIIGATLLLLTLLGLSPGR